MSFLSNDTNNGILITTTTFWPSVVMLALRLEEVGFSVTLLCPRAHPAWTTRLRCRELKGGPPSDALLLAFEASDPILVVPTDDRAVAHLHALRPIASERINRILDRSIGRPSAYPTASSRVSLSRVARDVGMQTPVDAALTSQGDLDEWLDRTAGPWILKADGTWGGLGVRVARTVEEARRAHRDLARKVPLVTALSKWLIKRDPFWMLDRATAPPPAVCAQSYVSGRPGNVALFCRDGEVLGATVAEAEGSAFATGPTTFVRVVERPDLLDQARRLIRRLGFSGFCGLDFMVDDATGEAILIEMNPRITALSGIRHGLGVDPITAAAASALRQPPRAAPKPTSRVLYAHFPVAWLAHPNDPRLALCHDDVPWDEPDLIAEVLNQRSWTRKVLAHALTMLARRRQGHPVAAWSSDPGVPTPGRSRREQAVAASGPVGTRSPSPFDTGARDVDPLLSTRADLGLAASERVGR